MEFARITDHRLAITFPCNHERHAANSRPSVTGRSVAWLARLLRVQEVVSSNLTVPTISPPESSEESNQ